MEIQDFNFFEEAWDRDLKRITFSIEKCKTSTYLKNSFKVQDHIQKMLIKNQVCFFY